MLGGYVSLREVPTGGARCLRTVCQLLVMVDPKMCDLQERCWVVSVVYRHKKCDLESEK